MINSQVTTPKKESLAEQHVVIPAGYKQTEVGVIPEDWDVKTLQAVCKTPITYGIVQCGPHIENGIPYIRVSDMNSRELDITEMLRTSPSIAALFSRSKVEEGDVVYALRGKLGHVKMILRPLAGANLTQGTARISPLENISNRYLFWTLQSPKSLEQAAQEAKGSTFVEITLANLKRIKIPIPKRFKEQDAIANVLSDSNSLIAEFEKLFAKKQAIKTATMQQLLTGRTRLPQFAKRDDGTLKGYKCSELGFIPEDWDVLTCGEIGKFRGGSGFPISMQGQTSGNYPFYKVSDMNNDGNSIFMSDSNNWISTDIRKKLGSPIFPAGCIIFAKVGAAVFLERKKILTVPSCIDNNLAAFELNINHCDIRFIHYILLSLNFGDYVSTTALPSLSSAILSQIKITLPSINEQEAIATILSDMDDELEAIEQKLAKIRNIKQGMMQQLLTGGIRLPLDNQP
ncbi:restriction endonuclease subunit S [Hafnia alvei]|uniref:restriction endonuclease subunit S n=1 Tax=Hafnia alvei TaxID=569 RepID=UPI0010344704|nr:restriction endonuclease subunit S [Hafnia alvei]TBM19470.1 restriction endonuclease subunit S [Hafnia alvei]HDL7422423.1 restriction endonuclease subunit S [Yersinia enterocolitica]HDL8097648.1 restriction endonuclease subunit S [Yersinia enterocolitica]